MNQLYQVIPDREYEEIERIERFQRGEETELDKLHQHEEDNQIIASAKLARIRIRLDPTLRRRHPRSEGRIAEDIRLINLANLLIFNRRAVMLTAIVPSE